LSRLRRRSGDVCENNRNWLINLYEEQGIRCLEKLNGTFCGLLIDRRKHKAFLFNDRYGIGRIYWHEDNGSLYFASEAKALLQILPELRSFDDEGVGQFLKFGCTLGTRTLFKGIQTIPGGSVWRFEDEKCHKTTYFSAEEWERQTPLSVEDFESEFQNTLTRVVPRYFESESRIGISLTAGLDTRMLMACQPANVRDVLSYTFDGPMGRTADSRLAAQVADALGLEHHVLRLGSDFFSDFESYVDRTISVTDGCFGATGAHEIYLNGLARQLAPLRITGNYGGEVLREVSTFKPLDLSPDLFSRDAATITGTSANFLDKQHPVTFAAFCEIPWKLSGSLRAGESRVAIRTPYLDNDLVALAYRVPTELRRSPEPAMRIIRQNPLISAIPTDMGFLSQSPRLGGIVRRALAKAACKLDYFSSEGVPPGLCFLDSFTSGIASVLRIAGTHKYLRYRNWFRHQLAGYVRDAIADVRLRQSPFWNDKFLAKMAGDHIAGRANYVREINSVITLGAVERFLLHPRPVTSASETKEGEFHACREVAAAR
jgi:asparagine synthase (glutamine-hydrolysing)